MMVGTKARRSRIRILPRTADRRDRPVSARLRRDRHRLPTLSSGFARLPVVRSATHRSDRGVVIMSIAINTPNGHIGRVLTSMLLDAGEHVVVLTRDADRVVDFARRGATVYEGDLEDLSFVKDATRDAQALFWATPQAYAHRDIVWFQIQLAKNLARAIEANGVPYVLNVSSLGAQHTAGTGVIQGMREVERLLDETSAHVLHLRAGYFMENFLHSLRSIQGDGAIYLPVDGAVETSMIATGDLAVQAANLLCEPDWTGHAVREIVGPRPISFDEAATIIGEVFGRPVDHVCVTPERARAGMVRRGWSRRSADLVIEMYAALAEGKLVPTDVPLLAPTTLRCHARTTLRAAHPTRA
jgi:uncharacterized protein YbjT (DUF2867 family)